MAEVVVITGASSGIGRATVREFAKHGAHIGLLARNEGALNDAKDEVESLGGRALAIPTDVTDSEQVEAAASRHSLVVGLIAWGIDLTLACMYFGTVYWMFRGRVEV